MEAQKNFFFDYGTFWYIFSLKQQLETKLFYVPYENRTLKG